MSGKPGSFESGKSRNEKQDEKKRGGDEVLSENNKTAKKLAKATQKKPGEKEKSKWKFGVGTTEARDEKNPLNSISATGLKIENKESNFEVTAGIGTMQEQKVPGEIPENTTGATIALNWKF